MNKKKIFISIFAIILAITVGVLVGMIYIDKEENDTNIQLPKVYFKGDITNMQTKQDERNIEISYKSKDVNFETYAKIKIQGTSSLSYDKKNYTIKLYEDENYENSNKIDVGKGWGSQSKYCLKANWIDKTHARNIVSARLAAVAQEKYNVFSDTPHNGTIDGYPIEVYINGDFLGIYTFNIPKDDWLWNLDDENPDNIVIGIGDYTKAGAFKEEITTFEGSGIDLEVGQDTPETIEKVNRLIRFVKDSSIEEFRDNIDEYIDLDSSLNYVAMVTAMDGVDNLVKNLMMVTYDGKVWYPSLYDLDCTWGTFYDGSILENYDALPKYTSSALWPKMLEAFPNEVADRYFTLRKELLTKENILKEFNDFISGIPESSLAKENKRWKNIPGQDITQIEEFLDYRLPYEDKYMNGLYNVDPSIEVVYSTKEKTSEPVKVTLKPNREDIVITNNEGSNTYTFTKNGTYTFEYQDWLGNNNGSIEVNVDWIE